MEFVHPEDLFKKIDLEVRDFGEPDDKLLNLCQETIHYSVKSGKVLLQTNCFEAPNFTQLVSSIVFRPLFPKPEQILDSL